MIHRCFVYRVIAGTLLLMPIHLAHGAGRSPGHATRANVTWAAQSPTPRIANRSSRRRLLRTKAGSIIRATTTDAFGRFTAHNLPAGNYTVVVHLVGYRPITRALTIAAAATSLPHMDFAMTPVTLSLEAMQVTASAAITVDTHTGDQLFQETEFHGAPTVTTSQILQQSIVGAARAPTARYTFADSTPSTRTISTASRCPRVSRAR
jgi:hypothetical protein